MTLKERLFYNFRLVPEGVWLAVQTVLGAMAVDFFGRLIGLTEWPTLDTWQAWLSAALLVGTRTLAGAVLAFWTGGGFQKPGERAVEPVHAEGDTGG